MVLLVDLPVEIIQLIAGCCPALDILALGRTCRHLRFACDDAAVFQHSFETSLLSEPSSPSFQDKNALIRFMKAYIEGGRIPCQRHNGPVRTWACLAVAVSRLSTVTSKLARAASIVKINATLESQQLGRDTKELIQGLVGFLSTLPVWGYAGACNAEIAAILDSLCPVFFSQRTSMQHLRIDRSLGDEYPIRFAFCLSLSGLQADDWRRTVPQSTESGDPRVPLGPGTDALLSIVRSVFHGAAVGPGYETFVTSWIGRQTHALLLTALITRNLQYVAQHGQPGLLALGLGIAHGARTIQPRVLNPAKIEFINPWYFSTKVVYGYDHQTDDSENNQPVGHMSNLNISTPSRTSGSSLRPRFPILDPNFVRFRGNVNDKGRYFYPFAGDDWWAWYTTRVRDIARRLDEGEWYGYYTYGLNLAGQVDDPMERIRFRRTSCQGDTYSVEALECFDGVGPFTLRGYVNASDTGCSVRIEKQYAGHGFTWIGQVTPLGIIGEYRFPQSHRPYGYFWLWKRSWMDDA
ncbi:hypothetical protein F4775DRAFT_186920 [Biscogniauxia sp. FL1348]|nr:hypothetical protein F4775DRAFT_186920 [Biscogniauxia sp. FL1348]